MKAFFYEAFLEEEEALKKALDNPGDCGFSAATIQESGHDEPPAPVISVRTQSVLPEAWDGKVRAVLTRSAGYDHVLSWQRRSPALRGGYLPEYCVRAVAEQALLLWTALLRKLPSQQRHFQTFNRDGLTGGELLDRTLLVVGVGRIGSQILRLGEALGMRCLGVDLDPRFENVRYVSFAEGLKEAEVIVCSMNLNPSSREYFTRDTLAGARPGALFVNVARGEMAPHDDLLELLERGILGGVGLDVYENEWAVGPAMRGHAAALEVPGLEALRRLAEREDVLLTPHNAFNTIEAVRRKAEQSARQLAAFEREGRFVWPIPPPE